VRKLRDGVPLPQRQHLSEAVTDKKDGDQPDDRKPAKPGTDPKVPDGKAGEQNGGKRG
jgi:hypothetical protein